MSALVTRFDVLVGVAFGVGAVAVAGVVLLLVAAGRADRRGRAADVEHVVASEVDRLEHMLTTGRLPDAPRYVRDVPDDDRDPIGWLDPMLATLPTPRDGDDVLELVDRTLAAIADAAPVEHVAPVLRILCDPADGGAPCPLHDPIGCRYSGPKCCPLCPIPST